MIKDRNNLLGLIRENGRRIRRILLGQLGILWQENIKNSKLIVETFLIIINTIVGTYAPNEISARNTDAYWSWINTERPYLSW